MHLKIEVRGNTIGDLMDGMREAIRKTKVQVVMRTGSNIGNQESIGYFRMGYPGIEYDILIQMGNRKKQG